VPRSRGALCGTLLVLLGVWGGLLPFIGPYVDFGFAPDRTWFYTTERLQLSVAPAIAVALGGLVVLVAAGRVLAMAGALLAALGGTWFVVGRPVAALWDVQGVGAPLGTEEGRRLAEDLSGFSALGVLAVFLAALALGRFAVVGVREAEEYGGHGDDGHADPYDGARNSSASSPYQGSSGTTQPLAPAFGRYARPPGDEPSGPPHASDQRVAGDTGRPRL
jgi:hypothetical protein